MCKYVCLLVTVCFHRLLLKWPNPSLTTSELNQSCLRCLDTTRSSRFSRSAKTSSGTWLRCLLTDKHVVYCCLFIKRHILCCSQSAASVQKTVPTSDASVQTRWAGCLWSFLLTASIHSCCIVFVLVPPASHVIWASCCWLWAVDSDASPDREKSLELIRYLVPDVFNGALVDSLSGPALSAAGLAASFLLEGNERAQLTAPPTSICSVIKAQKPGWLLLDPRESCNRKPFYIKWWLEICHISLIITLI